MGTFTVLGEAELTALAGQYGLGAVRSFAVIAAGTINSNFEMTTERGRFFVRVNEGKSEEDVAWEARLVAALADKAVVTPPPLVALDGRPYAPIARSASAGPRSSAEGGAESIAGKWASVFAWRDGHHLHAEQVTPQLAELFGSALAQLHVAGLALPTDWRRRSIYDHEHLLARFARIEHTGDPALATAIPILREELATAGTAMPIRQRATHGIIHGDLFRDNVLWERGRISAILDFEQASGGSLAYDLAVCINDWCWRETPTPEPRLDLAEALLKGYQLVRALAPADREALPYEIRAAATRFTITRITDVYLANVTNPAKDFRAFLARVEAWRGPSLGQLTASV